jgi:hypothetical protein
MVAVLLNPASEERLMNRIALRTVGSPAAVSLAKRAATVLPIHVIRVGSFPIAAALLIAAASSADVVTIATAPVGDPGNIADSTGYGSVDYSFRMGRTEVTNAQYVEFLNAVAAADDPHQLFFGSSDTGYGIVRTGSSGSYAYAVKPPTGSGISSENKPVILVSWTAAVRFANWLHNGQGSGDTETGAYTLSAGATRNPGAKWALPTEDE